MATQPLRPSPDFMRRPLNTSLPVPARVDGDQVVRHAVAQVEDDQVARHGLANARTERDGQVLDGRVSANLGRHVRQREQRRAHLSVGAARALDRNRGRRGRRARSRYVDDALGLPVVLGDLGRDLEMQLQEGVGDRPGRTSSPCAPR